MPLARSTTLALLASLLSALPVAAQDKADPNAAAKKMAQDMQTAVTKGVRWLTAQQKPEGHWTYDNKPLQLPVFPMRSGVSALCALTLMKCGISPDEPAVKNAFQVIHEEGFKWTYEVGCILLALEAKANFDPNRKVIQAPGAPMGEGTRTRDDGGKKKKKKGRPSPKDMKLAKRCVDWLVDHQRESGLWRYSGGTDEDVSNAQYAMLGLDAAERMGISVPKAVYVRAAKRLVEIQKDVSDKDKDKVIDPFPVPGADNSFAQLRKIEAKLLKDIKKIERSFKKVPEGERDKDGHSFEERTQTAERKAAEKISETMERGKMTPRGWQYYPPGTGGHIWQKTVTGSLTCSALASLFICKARLEGSSAWNGIRAQVDQALRDGAAWMSLHFTVKQNPGTALHQLYYLYGLERAGVLGLVHRFGEHAWFDEGARQLLRQQSKEGSWTGGGSTSGKVPDTCFALLFLSRGTTPVVKIPGRVMTGVKR